MNPKTILGIGAFLVLGVSSTLGGQTEGPVFRVGGDVIAPRPVNHPDPEYSDEARRAGRQGTCTISLIVSKEGDPENIKVSSPLGMGLDEKAIEAIRKWTFEPARKEGKPVTVQISIAVTFRMGKEVSTAVAREALEKAVRPATENQRSIQKRVYRIEDASTSRVCRPAQEQDGKTAMLSIAGLSVDAQQYRLRGITFTNNTAITSATALRALFPIKDGDIFDVREVSEGLRNLRHAYRVQGFVSFDSSVEATIDKLGRTISLQVTCNEGRQFFVDHIDLEGIDDRTFQKARESLYLKPGDLYNENLANLWLQKNSRLVPRGVTARDCLNLKVDENVGTVAMTYDLRRCAD